MVGHGTSPENLRGAAIAYHVSCCLNERGPRVLLGQKMRVDLSTVQRVIPLTVIEKGDDDSLAVSALWHESHVQEETSHFGAGTGCALRCSLVVSADRTVVGGGKQCCERCRGPCAPCATGLRRS